jgi:PAS domain S-box-containing protein
MSVLREVVLMPNTPGRSKNITSDTAFSFGDVRSPIDHNADVIVLIDSDGEIRHIKGSTEHSFGYAPEELVGQNWLEFVHPDDRDYSRRALQEVVAKPQALTGWDARMLHRSGHSFWVENLAAKVSPESSLIIVRQRDINERKAIEVDLRRQVEELTRCNSRLEEFTNTAAHDLREPLRAISSYTDMLVDETGLDAGAKQMAKFIVDGTARMSALIDDLLTFARTGIHESPEQVHLQQVVSQATMNLAREIRESGAKVEVGILPTVIGIESHLVRLFQNLIGNAVKHRGIESPEVHITAERDGLNWLVKIKDNGVGIAPENHARVFMPFIRFAKRDIAGTGLGLAVCKTIVEGMKGRIWIESEIGAGSTFFFTIAGSEATTGKPEVNTKARGCAG